MHIYLHILPYTYILTKCFTVLNVLCFPKSPPFLERRLVLPQLLQLRISSVQVQISTALDPRQVADWNATPQVLRRTEMLGARWSPFSTSFEHVE